MGIATALLVFGVGHHLALLMRILVAWDAFAFASLALAWVCITLGNAQRLVQTAQLQDSNRTAIFLFVVGGAFASLLAVGLLLGTAKGLVKGPLVEHITVAGVTVVLSWCLTHTVFTLHYAHIFYVANDNALAKTAGAGLDFPQEKEPDFLDFAYFAFVVGMTCQVSDVQITSRRVRRIALVHGVLSFIFNTVILALSINLASSLF
jgi:uncharacterized membrane protein